MSSRSNISLCTGRNNSLTKDGISEEHTQFIEILTRIHAKKNHKEYLYLCNDHIKITRCDEDKSSLFLSCDGGSYIIIERLTEPFQEKPVRNSFEWEKMQTSSTPKRSTGSLDKTAEFDLTGSPLSCHFLELKIPELESSQDSLDVHIKQKFPIKTYRGFSIENARKLSAKLNFAVKTLKKQEIYLPPLWIACDEKSKQTSAFLGTHYTARKNNIMIVSSEGPYFGADSLPVLDHINSHFNLGSVLPRVKTKANAIYEIIYQKDEKSSSSVDLHCEWFQPLSTLSSPNLDATTTASLHLELDDESLYSERVILENFIKGFNEKCLTWRKRKNPHKVDVLLEAYFESYGERDKNAINMVPDLDKMVESKFLEMNYNKEFTEEIWNILKESSSLLELSDGFRTVFKNVSSGVIRPRIHVKNETEFAAVCRSLMRGQGNIPLLENWDAINMLIQIGLEKIKKDYLTVFQVYDLVTTEQLCFYTNWSTNKTPYKDCLNKLQKLNLTLQVVVTLKRALNLPNIVLSHLTSKTLLDLEKTKDLPKDFEYQVETSLLKSILDNTTPTVWSYETWSVCDENPNYEKSLRVIVKSDEEFFKLQTDVEKGDLSTSTNDNKSTESQKYFSLCIMKNGNIF